MKDNRVQFDGHHNTRYQAKLNEKIVADDTRECNNVEVDMDAMPEAIDRHVGNEVLVTVHASEDDFQSEDSDVEDNGATPATDVQTNYKERLKAMRQDPILKCFKLNHLIASRTVNYDWPFGTLPFGLFGSDFDTRDLETYPRTYSGHF